MSGLFLLWNEDDKIRHKATWEAVNIHRKINSVILPAVCVFLLTGCSATQKETESAGKLPQLKIGSAVSAPYFYRGEDGFYTGVDYEIAKEACQRIGYEPVFTEIPWEDKGDLLEDGTVDCIWSCFSMNNRMEQYQWAGPYLKSSVVVVTAADSDIHTIADLAGKDVAVRIASNAERYFLSEEAPDVNEVSTFSNMEQAFVSFGKGYCDAVAGIQETLEEFTSAEPELYRYLDAPVMMADLGVAFRKDADTELVGSLTDVLAAMRKDGTIASIAERYGASEADEAGDAG